MYKYFEDLKVEFEYLSKEDKHPNHKMQPLMADAFFKFLNKSLPANVSADSIKFNSYNTECEYRDGYENTLY